LDLLLAVLTWTLAVAERFRGSGALAAAISGNLQPLDVLYTCTFAVSSGILLGLAYCSLHVCSSLGCLVDVFCSGVSDHARIIEAVHEWNVLQAVLRSGSGAVELCIFVLQTTALSVLLLGALDFVQGPPHEQPTLVPAAMVLAYTAQVFVRATAVTDKCARVPPLVNSLASENLMDLERQYVVQYVLHSDAGFHMFHIKVTFAMVLKVMYVSVAVVFTVVTKF